MARLFFFLSMVFSLFLPSASAQSRSSDEILEVLNAQVEAWNRGDLETFMETYWNSEELTFFSGNRPVKGWNSTLERYRKRYQSDGQEMGQVTFSDIEVTLLAGDAGFVRGRWALSRSKQPDLGGLFTLLVRRFSDGWKIVHDHTSTGE